MTTSTSTAGSTTETRSEPPAAPAPPHAAPSAELLEFLGEFSSDDGEWIDPLELEEAQDVPGAAQRDGDD